MEAAQRMVAEYLNDPAIRDMSLRATLDHPLKFDLQGLKACKALLNIKEAFACDPVGHGTGLARFILQVKQGTNRFDVKAECPRVSNKAQPIEFNMMKITTICRRSVGGWQQAYLFVITYRRDFNARDCRRLPDR